MRFAFYGNYSQPDQQQFVSAQESDLGEICAYLHVNAKVVNDRITYHIFDSREKKQQEDPFHSISRASARFNEMAIYRFWEPSNDPHFPHELTHLAAHTWETPYQLTTELDTWDGQEIVKTVEMVSNSFML